MTVTMPRMLLIMIERAVARVEMMMSKMRRIYEYDGDGIGVAYY